jgi:hypothetical protein
VLRQAWDARTLAALTRVAYKATLPHVAIIGHIPPKEFRMRLAEADMVGGSYNRFLPVYVERSKKLPIPLGIPEPLLNAEAARLRTAIGKASDLGRIHLGEHATRLWSADLYDEFTAADDEDAAWTEFTRRAAPYCLRIAALYAALDGTAIVSASHLQAAAALVRYSIGSAVFVLDKQMGDPRLDPNPPRHRHRRARGNRPNRHLCPVLPQRHQAAARRTPRHPDRHRPVRGFRRPKRRTPRRPLPPYPRDEERRKNSTPCPPNCTEHNGKCPKFCTADCTGHAKACPKRIGGIKFTRPKGKRTRAIPLPAQIITRCASTSKHRNPSAKPLVLRGKTGIWSGASRTDTRSTRTSIGRNGRKFSAKPESRTCACTTRATPPEHCSASCT